MRLGCICMSEVGCNPPTKPYHQLLVSDIQPKKAQQHTCREVELRQPDPACMCSDFTGSCIYKISKAGHVWKGTGIAHVIQLIIQKQDRFVCRLSFCCGTPYSLITLGYAGLRQVNMPSPPPHNCKVVLGGSTPSSFMLGKLSESSLERGTPDRCVSKGKESPAFVCKVKHTAHALSHSGKFSHMQCL